MLLYLGAKVRDEVLRLNTQQHRERVRRRCLHHDRDPHEAQNAVEECRVTVGDHVIDEILGRRGEYEPTESVQEDEDEAEPDQVLPGPDDLFERVSETRSRDLLLRLRHGAEGV